MLSIQICKENCPTIFIIVCSLYTFPMLMSIKTTVIWPFRKYKLRQVKFFFQYYLFINQRLVTHVRLFSFKNNIFHKSTILVFWYIRVIEITLASWDRISIGKQKSKNGCWEMENHFSILFQKLDRLWSSITTITLVWDCT